MSKASILGSVELFVKKGSDINLTCVTVTDEEPAPGQQQQPPVNKTPLHFTWHHNGQVFKSRRYHIFCAISIPKMAVSCSRPSVSQCSAADIFICINNDFIEDWWGPLFRIFAYMDFYFVFQKFMRHPSFRQSPRACRKLGNFDGKWCVYFSFFFSFS